MPTDLTVWDWLFDSPHSPLRKHPENELAGYVNAFTKERIDWRQVEEYTTHVSTALVKKYGLKPNQTVSLFSQNTIWYPVAMLGTLRAGMLTISTMPALVVGSADPQEQAVSSPARPQPTTSRR